MRIALSVALIGALATFLPSFASAQTAPSDALTVTLITEPLSSAPVLYPGKSDVPLDGSVRLVAVVNSNTAGGVAIDPTTLTYTWTVDGTTLSADSGIGKSAMIIDSPLQYRARDVSILVQTADGITGTDSVTFSAVEPSVLIYENDPLLGIRFNNALSGNYTINGSEDSLYAAPFSFPLKNGAPTVQWFLNNTLAQNGNEVTLRPTGNGTGTADLSLVAASDSMTQATANLSISFTSSSGNLFGL